MGANINQWQFPPNEPGKVVGWSDSGRELVNRDAGVNGLIAYADRAAVGEATVAADSIVVQAYATAGDNGGAEYDRVGSVPNHDLYVLDNTSSVFAITKRTIRLSQVGAFPGTTGNTARTAGLQSAFDYIEEVGGGCIEIDKEGYYDVDGSIGFPSSVAPLTKKLVIENKAGGIIRAASGLASPVIQIYGGASEPGTGQIEAWGLKVDNSAGSYIIGANSCTGIAATYLDQILLHDYECRGGFDVIADAAPTVGGDSGLTTVGVRDVILNNADIRGQIDAAIYPNWDNSGTAGGYLEVSGGYFARNQMVLTAKRNLKEIIWRGGLLEENRGGLTTQWISTPSFLDPARSVLIDGVKIKKTVANAITLKGSGRGLISNVVIEDLGYEYDGTGNVGVSARAIILQGASGISVRNVRAEMLDWTSVSEYVFYFLNDTTDGTLTGGKHDIDSVTLKNWRWIATGGDDGNPVSIQNVKLIDPPGAVNSVVASNFHPTSEVKYRVDDRLGEYTVANELVTYDGETRFSLADDAVVDLGDLSSGGVGLLTLNTVGNAGVALATTFRVRTNSSGVATIAFGLTTNIAVSTAAHDGSTMTGADGSITIFGNVGHVYVENRSGALINVLARWVTPA